MVKTLETKNSTDNTQLVIAAQEGKKEAFNLLYAQYRKYLRKKAYNFILKRKLNKDHLEDFIQHANIALLKAIREFDPNHPSANFESFLYNKIRGEFHGRGSKYKQIKPTADPRYISYYRIITHESDKFETRKGRKPSNQELAMLTDLSPEQIRNTQIIFSLRTTSLNSTVSPKNEGGKKLNETIGDKHTPDPSILTTRKLAHERLHAILKKILSPYQLEIINSTIFQNLTLAEIGKEIGNPEGEPVSYERIRQIKIVILEILAQNKELAEINQTL